jgi:hypothetical protein
MSANGSEKQPNDVADVHDEVKHTPRSPPPPCSSPAVTVCSPTPKPRPEIVNEAYPLCGTFRRTSEARAESKLKIGRPVPETDETVTDADLNKSANAFDLHASVVDDVHDDVKQFPRSPRPPRWSPEVAVCWPTPKLRPETVNDAYPLCGAFRSIWEAIAVSKLNAPLTVPATLPTVTNKLIREPVSAME